MGNDLNGAPLPTVTTTTQYDSFGNATSVSVGTGDGNSKTTTNIYALPDTTLDPGSADAQHGAEHGSLASRARPTLSERSLCYSRYALCAYANFGSFL
jgi:hypothetical protein